MNKTPSFYLIAYKE